MKIQRSRRHRDAPWTRVPQPTVATWTTTATALGLGHLHRPGHPDRHVGNTGTSSCRHLHGRYDQAHRAADRAANKTGATAGKIENGDTVTFTYSEPIAAASVWSG